MAKRNSSTLQWPVSYNRVKRSPVSKYDLLFKNVFLEYKSMLAKILGIEAGLSNAIQLPGLDARNIDGLVEGEDRLYHVEFQTKPDAILKWRMLEYFFHIVQHYSATFKKELPRVEQWLIHVGNADDTSEMHPPLNWGGTTHDYKFRDMRNLGAGWETTLESSELPMDWILRVVCVHGVNATKWEWLVRKVNRYCAQHPTEAKDLKAAVLIAAALREVDIITGRKLEKMLQVDISSLPAVVAAVDRAYDHNVINWSLQTMRNIADARGVTMTADHEANFHGLDEYTLQSVLVALATAKSKADLLGILATPPKASNEYRPG